MIMGVGIVFLGHDFLAQLVFNEIQGKTDRTRQTFYILLTLIPKSHFPDHKYFSHLFDRTLTTIFSLANLTLAQTLSHDPRQQVVVSSLCPT